MIELLETTVSAFPTSSANNTTTEKRPVISADAYLYIVLSSINVTLSLFSMLLFYRFGAREIHRVLRMLLIILSFFEALFHACVIVTYIPVIPPSSPLHTIFSSLIRFAMTMRNYSVAIISWSRVEAVVLPLRSKSGSTMFSGYRLGIMNACIAGIAIVLSVLMELAQKPGHPKEPHLVILTGNHGAPALVEQVFYTYQGVLPIILVVTATCVIVAFLRRHSVSRRALTLARTRDQVRTTCHHTENALLRNGLTTSGPAAPQVVTAAAAAPRMRSRRESQAVKIIVALSVTFAVLEFPTDVFGFVTLKTRQVELFVNILVELDSLGNFVIYTCTTNLFRGVWRRAWAALCRRRNKGFASRPSSRPVSRSERFGWGGQAAVDTSV